MVQLEEVEDPELDSAQPGPAPEYDSADDYEDTDSDISDDDIPTTLPSESISDRILALRDILSPKTRRTISTAIDNTTSAAKTGAWWSGKGLWVLSTGALMLMVPFAIAVVEEQQIVEQEKEIKAREGQGAVLAPGVESKVDGGGMGRAL